MSYSITYDHRAARRREYSLAIDGKTITDLSANAAKQLLLGAGLSMYAAQAAVGRAQLDGTPADTPQAAADAAKEQISPSKRERANRLDAFLMERAHRVIGERILFSEFYDQFVLWLPEEERGDWSKQRVATTLPTEFPHGAHTANRKWVANIAWENRPPARDARPWIAKDGKLIEGRLPS